MNSLVQQIMIWKKAYPIEKIDRHSDLDPARKWFDPGDGFPWTELLQRTWI
jgi:N-acetyl-anhydromuramyl-L-alanine amidase AmpD